MRSIWKGAISFGLVNIPVSLYSAEESNDLKFSLIDKRDESKIKYQRVNESTGKEVTWDNIVKAYEFDDGDYVVMTDEDFEKADVEATKTVDIETFIQRDELSLMYLEKPYYIAPTKGGEKPYVLLREALEKTEKIAIARVVIRTRAYLAAIYSLENVLVLNLIRFHDDLKSVEELKVPKSVKISDKEMELAESLIEGMTAEWNPEEYKDEYKDAVMKRIEAKSKKKGKALDDEEQEEEKASSSKVVDIMDLLKKSVEAKKAGNKEDVKETSKKKASK
ncbi:Ku protein [Proteiniclasticum sp.]|uniref:non-homologous end joining protein Ku n=1 Tax=Proteiniclasticum sp. TaxID=2053595 RepID=UPI0028A23ED1|nr:Ku protein [Proteiniclasticum sp.]